MTKSDLINAVAANADLSKKDAEKAVVSLIQAITGALEQGEKVQLVGFGTFEVRDRKARDGRNPLNGEPMHIPATKVPAFKAGKSLKDAVAK